MDLLRSFVEPTNHEFFVIGELQLWAEGFPREVATVYEDFLTCYTPVLKNSLQALYATGSVAHDAYLTGRSDVDGVVILEDDWRECCSQAQLDQAWTNLQSLHPDMNLQLQFASVDYMLKHMPFVDVVDWKDNGILVHGVEVRCDLPPVTKEMLQLDMLLGFLDRYVGLGQQGRLLPYGWDIASDGPTYCRHPSMIVLWVVQPARILYTWDTGSIASKSECVDWFTQHHPGPSGEWMREVLAWREAGFQNTEPTVLRWGPKIPNLTARFARFLYDRISGGATHFDTSMLDQLQAGIMSDLYRCAKQWLVSVPQCQRYPPLPL